MQASGFRHWLIQFFDQAKVLYIVINAEICLDTFWSENEKKRKAVAQTLPQQTIKTHFLPLKRFFKVLCCQMPLNFATKASVCNFARFWTSFCCKLYNILFLQWDCELMNQQTPNFHNWFVNKNTLNQLPTSLTDIRARQQQLGLQDDSNKNFSPKETKPKHSGLTSYLTVLRRPNESHH